MDLYNSKIIIKWKTDEQNGVSESLFKNMSLYWGGKDKIVFGWALNNFIERSELNGKIYKSLLQVV